MTLLLTGGWREREKAREDSWGPPRDSRPPGDREWDRDKDRDDNEKDREFDRERDFDRDDRFRRPRFDSFVSLRNSLTSRSEMNCGWCVRNGVI